MSEGHVLGYVVQSDIDYIIDWSGVAAWADLPEDNFSDVFELIELDRQANLAVLARRTPRQPF